jgi:hypothetical protein
MGNQHIHSWIAIVLNVDLLWFKVRALMRNLQKGNGASGKNHFNFFSIL